MILSKKQSSWEWAKQVITAARDWGKANGAMPSLAPASHKEYLREAHKLLLQPGPIEVWRAAAATGRPNVFRKRRAALRYFLQYSLAHQDRLQRSGHSMTPEWLAVIRQIEMLMRVQAAAPAGNSVQISARRKRSSKRSLLGHLPLGWQFVVVEKIDPEYALAALVQAVSACRPAELARGVLVKVVGNELMVEIAGVKVTKSSGHAQRILRWDLGRAHELVGWLASVVEDAPGMELTVRIDTAKAYGGKVRTAGRRAWPELPAALSPYCFRHAGASVAKAQKDREAVARQLGHATTETASVYGSWHYRAGGAGLAPDSAVASGEVRTNHRNGPSRTAGPAPGM
jgi:hypothetical protein